MTAFFVCCMLSGIRIALRITLAFTQNFRIAAICSADP